MIERQSKTCNKKRCDKIGPCKPVKTGTTTNDCNNLCIISHSGGKENDCNKNQYRHKCQYEIQNPERIKIQKKITNRKTITLYPRCFRLYIYYQDNYRKQHQHKNECSQIFFNDVKIYDFHKVR